MAEPNAFELQILMQLKGIKEVLDGLGKADKGVKGLGDDTTKSNKKMAGGFKDAQMGLRNMLAPLTMIRRTVWQVGIAWSLTGGMVVAAISDVSKKQKELNDISTKTGFSTEEISKQLYNFNIDTKDARQGVAVLNEALSFLQRTYTRVTVAVTEYIGREKQAAAEERIYMDLLNKEMRANGPWKEIFVDDNKRDRRLRNQAHDMAIKQIEDERIANNLKSNEAIMLRGELNAKILQMQGNELQSFRELANAQREIYIKMYGEKGDIVQLFDKFYKIQEANLKAARWGLKSELQMWLDMEKQWGQQTANLFQNVFVDAFDNNLSNAGQIFSSWLISIRNSMLATLGNNLANMIIPNISNVWSSMFGGIQGGAGGTTSTYQGRTVWSPSHFQEGGIAGIGGPELAVVGEREPELITPLSKLNNTGSSVTYYINAVDAASFNELVSRNPEAIVNVTSNAIRKNKSLRKTIKNYT